MQITRIKHFLFPSKTIREIHSLVSFVFSSFDASPKHKPIKIGTLNSILTDISIHLKMDKKELIEELFK